MASGTTNICVCSTTRKRRRVITRECMWKIQILTCPDSTRRRGTASCFQENQRRLFATFIPETKRQNYPRCWRLMSNLADWQVLLNRVCTMFLYSAPWTNLHNQLWGKSRTIHGLILGVYDVLSNIMYGTDQDGMTKLLSSSCWKPDNVAGATSRWLSTQQPTVPHQIWRTNSRKLDDCGKVLEVLLKRRSGEENVLRKRI